ncbi:MAG TPA: phosphate ABC transporter permease PtsA [Verrucomicrobiales bacterium]|nr:phosphate ABC transporter permease PtsA [Verrucomicrobiales bacterium]
MSEPCSAIPSENPFALTPLERRKKAAARRNQWIMFGFCALLIIPLVLILVDIFWKAAPVLSLDFLWQNPVNKGKEGGLWAPLVGTFYLVVGSLLFVAPVGIFAAIYLNEYAREGWVNRVIGITVTSLAGVPSIVHALFGLGAFVLGMLPAINRLLADPARPETRWEAGLLTASLTVAVMNLPVIITSTREALGAVPQSFREACWNLGATRWQTIRTIVLPNSLSGILTGIILVVSRAAGETAPILFTGATFFKFVADSGTAKLFPYGIGEPFMAMSMHLNIISNQISQMPERMKFGSAAVLITLILAINSLAIALRVWLRGRKRW